MSSDKLPGPHLFSYSDPAEKLSQNSHIRLYIMDVEE
jgi:hypothetical protein